MAYFYAVLEDRNDNDWGYGSDNLRQAERMALDMGPEAYIAVIEEGNDPICVREITKDEFEIRTKYAIRNVPYNYDDSNEATDFHIFEADTMEEINAELIRIGAKDDTHSVEIYTVDEDGDFWQGSDYDTPSNFRKRTAAARSVKQICKMAGMTQNAVAEHFGIPWRTFSNWCTGSRECPEYTKLMMQELLGLYRR